jgi:XRE family transcriptional regulator, aerobic/anaerobic benzoate catabolism transcriptional regulator
MPRATKPPMQPPTGPPAQRPRKRRRPGPDDEAYLGILAGKIRGARTRRAITRNALAADSGVSLRFLAQLESGQGNPSILVLRRIASALGVDPDALLSGEVTRPAAENFITLIGLRGAGKTTLGRRLAAHRGVPFFELDREVEREYGATIGEILQLHGQPGYRRFEREILQAVLAQNAQAVIETGGGLAADPDMLPLLLERSLAVWLRASPDEHMQRVIDQGDLRPMASSREAMRELKDILNAREPFYRQAPLHLNTSGRTPNQSFKELLDMLERR